MDISEKCCQEITPRQRVIAVYNALKRKDRPEIDRLIKNAPKDGNHRQAILAIGQAQKVYDQFMTKVTNDFFEVYGELMEALSFCDGWVTADGAIDNKEYQEKCAISGNLKPVVAQIESQLAAVHQAMREWCQKNEIPVEMFSEPGLSCYLSLRSADKDSAVDSQMLNKVRGLYDGITLS